MNNQNQNWYLVGTTENVDVEDIIRFDHNDKTYCIYRLDDGYFATCYLYVGCGNGSEIGRAHV